MIAISLDPAIPFLEDALDPALAAPVLSRHLSLLRLDSARLIRHKPGRRALIEYRAGALTFIGKIRAKGLDTRTYELMVAARAVGLPVPEPLGLVPEFKMVVQRKEPGVPMTGLLPGPDGVALAESAAELAHQLHEARIPTDRAHGLADELRILHERVPSVAERQPAWRERLAAGLDGADRLAATLPAPVDGLRGIHRDYYADQLLVGEERIVMLDLDLYTQGDPALDIGNFAAHIIEQALRDHGDANALEGCERALVERYLALAGSQHRYAVEVYTTLSLVRHIWISTRIPERRSITEALIQLSEQRLGIRQCLQTTAGVTA